MAGRLQIFGGVAGEGIIRVTAVNTDHQSAYMRVTTRVRVLAVWVSGRRVRMAAEGELSPPSP